ncbi:hypothetical protein N7492_000080 [Penicillium capsulatum]|uniref:ATP-dependent DNA ligase family profile domain-containing protein n=1 Tax=Penicillium capsulatum TaxID=69766 RepID=A0A9W9IR34_9EURO|nr:hypothetical protein N7492_000080 [Penicillium capsulatum]
MVQPVPGSAAISEQEILDFNRYDSQNRLEASFAKAIAQRWEGYVLKASEEPYFPFYSAGVDTSFGRWIKLKKDYIPGLGDTVDLTLIGATYKAQEATALSCIKKLRWTHFLVGCLVNKDAVTQGEDIPRFRVIDVVNYHCMHRRFMQLLNQLGEFHASDPDDLSGFRVEYGNKNLPEASVLFKKPFVVEMMGSGFEKPSGARFFTLRFPRILKIHTDRGYEDAASYQELQILADEARSIPLEDLSQEREQWRKRLKVGNGLNQYIVQRSQSPSSQGSESGLETRSESEDSGEEQSSSIDDEVLEQQQPTAHGKSQSTVFVDETLMSPAAASPPDPIVLTENNNLSSRQDSSQKKASISQSHRNHVETVPPKRAKDVESVSPQPTSLIAVHRTQTQSRPASVASQTQSNASKSFDKVPDLRSPLTTIPVYMPSSAELSATEEEKPSSGLCEFLGAIGSAESRSYLRQSNPRAASQDKALGIVLVNPCERPLGHEIHRISTAISQLRDTSLTAPRGQVFFLDSLVLEQNIDPEELQYCLRDTWSDVGHQYYYACLCWGAGDAGSLHGESGDALHTEKHAIQGSSRAFVSFEPSEILALGEYTSAKPIVHASKMP